MKPSLAYAILLLSIVLTLMLPTPSPAAYSQPASAVSAGCGFSTSTSYSNLGVIGQTVVGSSSASYAAEHGFLPVLGGLKVLYPVISATPGVITFSLVTGGSDGKPLTVANEGGSSLEWSVVKGSPDTVFSVSPASGLISGAGSSGITVTADATGLATGSHYSNTLTISGAGISGGVQVTLDLEVIAQASYRLTVTPVSDTAGKGGGTITSDSGGISCQNSGSDPAAKSGVCQADFSPGSVVTLMQTPDSDSTLATWTGGCGGSDTQCQVTMNGDTLVSATFPYSPITRVGSSGTGYESLALAYGGAAGIDTILARAVTIGESFVLDGDKAITFSGGLNAYYLPQNAWTTISGTLTVARGALTVDRLVVK